MLCCLQTLVYPLVAWAISFGIWTHAVDTLAYWVLAPLSGWAFLSCGLWYHDVCGHRCAFGKWGSWFAGLWIVSGCPMLIKEINLTFVAKHRIHHRHTFEATDPVLFRNGLDTSLQRVLCLNGLYRHRHFAKLAYLPAFARSWVALEEYLVELGPDYNFKVKLEGAIIKLVSAGWLLLCANGGAVNQWANAALSASIGGDVPATAAPALRTLLTAVSWFGVFDTIRYALEHADQDQDNPFSQATLYETGFWSRLATTWDSGDCHNVHHAWTDVPVYRMAEAVALVNPVAVRHGVALRTGFWRLMFNYLCVGHPHGNAWPAEGRTGEPWAEPQGERAAVPTAAKKDV